MAKVSWNPAFEIGIPHIDKQHQELVSMINKLDNSISGGMVNPEVETVLVELVRYSTEHFGTEERFMLEIGYPQLAEHLKLHHDLREAVKSYLIRLKQGNTITARELITFLAEWLIRHIMHEDKQIGLYHKLQQAKSTAQPTA
ncbi:MAG: hemerythrin family protein [bacterium]